MHLPSSPKMMETKNLKIMKTNVSTMKKSTLWIAFAAFILSPLAVTGQQTLREKILNEGIQKSVFEKKFHWGVAFHLYWSGIEGEQVASTYFFKPSLGGSLRAEYYLNSFLGVGVGAGYQQRGAGINNVDVTGGAFAHPWITNDVGTVGDPDSTYLERLRFNTLEFPVTLLLRTPKDVFSGMRITGAVGPTFIHNMSTNLTMQSIVDGFHPYNWVTDNYIRNEFGLQASLGVDIDSGGGKSICQIQFVYTSGSKNIYKSGVATGNHTTYGVRIAWLF